MLNDRLREGTYLLSLTAHDGQRPISDDDTALAVLRGGQILGSGRWGGVFRGSHRFDDATGLNHVHVTLEIPPDARLVTGYCAGTGGAVFEIVGAMRSDGRRAATVVEVAGAPLEVALTYLAPPPA